MAASCALWSIIPRLEPGTLSEGKKKKTLLVFIFLTKWLFPTHTSVVFELEVRGEQGRLGGREGLVVAPVGGVWSPGGIWAPELIPHLPPHTAGKDRS